MTEHIVCPICGTEFEGETFDECPYCCWGYLGFESELEPDEKESYNLISLNEARRNFAAGKDIWGDKPLPERK